MDVYLVPVGADSYELYCEVPDEPEPEAEGAPAGFFARMRQRFNQTLAEAERERRQNRAAEPHAGWMTRVKQRSMRWIAESIAEQRLLWHLRRQTEACLFYPDDVQEERATAALRQRLGRDRQKHRLWLAVDSVGFVASGFLMLVPGPNILAYYFAFRLVGHYLSLMGARRGLDVVRWTTVQSPPLTELRRVIGLAPDVRVRRVHDIAMALRLEHLPTFFERTVVTAP